MGDLATMEFAVCVATFYEDLGERLVNGAVEAFGEEGVAPTSVGCGEVVRGVRPVRRGGLPGRGDPRRD